MIYIARSGTTDFVKIGYAKVVVDRLAMLQTGNPHPLVLLRELPGNRTTEALFHAHFRPQRYRIEWFTFVPEMLTIEVRELSWPTVLCVDVDDDESHLQSLFRSCGKRQNEIAILVGRSTGAISQWVNGERQIPADIVPKVEEVTGIPRHQLRPDLWAAPVPAEARAA